MSVVCIVKCLRQLYACQVQKVFLLHILQVVAVYKAKSIRGQNQISFLVVFL